MNTQKEKLLELIAEGENVLNANRIIPGVEPEIVPRSLFETWMGKINMFNERYLKKHPMYQSIFNCYFHRKNKASNCYDMLGLLKAVESDEELDNDLQHITIKNVGGTEKIMSSKDKIFISHRTTDSEVADMIRDFLVGVGVDNDKIFCSSLPGNDVQQKIEPEVKEALKNSCLNIAILSKSYYESAYCLNEAGVLWYEDTPVLPVGLLDVGPSDMVGFLSSDYKMRRLNSESDIAYIADLLDKLGIISKLSFSNLSSKSKKLIKEYNEYMKNTPLISQNKIKLMGVAPNGKVSESAFVENLVLNTSNSKEMFIEEIKELYAQIAEIHLVPREDSWDVFGQAFGNYVNLPENKIALITEVAEILEMPLRDDFFTLGCLKENFSAASALMGTKNYVGTDDEVKKGKLIDKLYWKIEEFLDWSPVEDGFRDIMCVKLLLSNTGETPDQDIDVSLRIARKAYKKIEEMPRFEGEALEYINRDCDLYSFFKIASTAQYVDFEETLQGKLKTPTYSTDMHFPRGHEDEEEYYNNLKEALSVDVYEDGDDVVIKLKFDYLKHNTVAAYPVPIMLNEKIERIPYEITSKNFAQIISGEIIVE